jgi:hypothetical protein
MAHLDFLFVCYSVHQISFSRTKQTATHFKILGKLTHTKKKKHLSEIKTGHQYSTCPRASTYRTLL